MCGFAGFIDLDTKYNAEDLKGFVTAMNDRIYWRGPDDFGTWVDAENGVALGHRRLSVIDLSPLGHQPMVSACGRYIIAYNGEVYNFPDLRSKLEASGKSFKSHTDTEVILEACAAWGVEATLKLLIGMFAFVLWDRQTQSLTLARDRLGIKPLYWGKQGNTLFFASQPGAFAAHPDWAYEIDRNALASYLRHSYVPAPQSIFQGIKKLEPGCFVEISVDGNERKTQYWDIRSIATTGTRNCNSYNDEEAIEALDAVLRDAVSKRMVADVPLGAFLSGGVDSSTVVALMQVQSDRPVKTFSIGFNEQGYDEAKYAKAVAKHLGTDHTELYVDSKHALEVLPNIPKWYDEPFSDSSQIPTYLVSEMTRKHVTVALSGDGGDELFAGYNRYFWGERLWNWFGRWPKPLRNLAASAIHGLAPQTWDQLFSMIPEKMCPPQPGDKIYKLAQLLSLDGQDALYRRLVSQWDDPARVVLNGEEYKGVIWDETVQNDIGSFSERMQLFDTLTYLPDDILTKVDRASMAVSLEARVPLLDHRVVEFAWGLPNHMKIRNGQGKWLLRQVLYKYVPKDLIERPKMGFGVPIDRWLRKDLRDWGEELLDPLRLHDEGYFNVDVIRKTWDEHQSGTRNWHYPLWTILMFQSWLEMQKKSRS